MNEYLNNYPDLKGVSKETQKNQYILYERQRVDKIEECKEVCIYNIYLIILNHIEKTAIY